MPKRRRNTSSPSCSSPDIKRARSTPPYEVDDDHLTSKYNVQPRVDPTYGQRGAFPGLDSADREQDLFYGPASDGLQYLRMVRSEARTVPNLLVAPNQVQSHDRRNGENSYGDYSAGFYEDGAYTAIAARAGLSTDDSLVDGKERDEEKDPQEAYYAAFSTRFLALRSILGSPPLSFTIGPGISSYHGGSASSHAMFLQNAWQTQWRTELLYKAPSMRVLASIHQDTVIRGLYRAEKLLSIKTLRRSDHSRNLGAWCWGLLAKCREVGQMSSEEVGVLRDLGKKALWIARKMRMRVEEEEEIEDEKMDVEDEELESCVEEAIEGESEIEEGEIGQDDEVLDGLENGSRVEIRKVSESEVPDITFSNILAHKKNVQNTSIHMSGASDRRAAVDALSEFEELKRAKARLLHTVGSQPRSASAEPKVGECEMKQDQDRETERAVEEADDGEQSDGSEAGAKSWAMLDMIVTVVGEFYGQKDLLEAREVWGEYE